jgi:hypothetical protein
MELGQNSRQQKDKEEGEVAEKKADTELGQNSRHQRRQGGRRGYTVKIADMELGQNSRQQRRQGGRRGCGEES